MEIWKLFYCIIIECVVFSYVVTRTISLNDIIAKELQPEISTEATNTFTVTSRPEETKQTSKYRKEEKVIPTKSIKSNYSKRPLYKYRNQLLTRETDNNERRIPLLKSLGILFDNLLTSDSTESHGNERAPREEKRQKYSSEKRNGMVCSCPAKPDAEPKTDKKTTTSQPSTISIEAASEFEDSRLTETTSTETHLTAPGHFRSFRQYKNLPLLFTRDSTSFRRDYNGFGSRGSPTFHGSFQRDISRPNRNNGYNTQHSKQTYKTNNEKVTVSDSRDSTGSHRIPRRGLRRFPNYTESDSEENSTEEVSLSEDNHSTEFIRRDFNKSERKDNVQIRRDKTEGTRPIPQYIRRLRGFIPEDKIGNITESVQSKEIYEESDDNITHSVTSNKQLADGNGPLSSETETICSEDETIKPVSIIPKIGRNKPSLVIFDGYSVTRDKNGENKLSGKAIHIHS